jgi:hypothetical protein
LPPPRAGANAREAGRSEQPRLRVRSGPDCGLEAEGHPRTIFKRAIERSNVAVAEATAPEVGRLSLDEALALTALDRPP